MARHATTTGALVHEALFYSDAESFVAGTAPFVREGIEAGDAVLVAVDQDKIQLLRDALGDCASKVEFADMRVIGRNPARIIPVWREFVDRNVAEGRGVRGVGEPIWAGRSDTELSECHLHEALLNVAFGEGPVWPLLCPYDTSALAPETVERARHTHPVLRDPQNCDDAPNGKFTHDVSCATLFAERLSEPPADHVSIEFDARSVIGVRRLAAREARRWGLTASRIDDIVLATSEVATNSVMHGGGGGLARVWGDDSSFVVEISDGGVVDDPLVGRRRPTTGTSGGRGLWLANALCDLVQLRTGPAGTVVRLHMLPR